jgi:hypothetical protein
MPFFASSNIGLLICNKGISPMPYLTLPTGEMYTGGVIGSTMAPTLFPTAGGCFNSSNPLSSLTLGVPPFPCIALLHAPFSPGYTKFMVMKGCSAALKQDDSAQCLFAPGGEIKVNVSGQVIAQTG